MKFLESLAVAITVFLAFALLFLIAAMALSAA